MPASFTLLIKFTFTNLTFKWFCFQIQVFNYHFLTQTDISFLTIFFLSAYPVLKLRGQEVACCGIPKQWLVSWLQFRVVQRFGWRT